MNAEKLELANKLNKEISALTEKVADWEKTVARINDGGRRIFASFAHNTQIQTPVFAAEEFLPFAKKQLAAIQRELIKKQKQFKSLK